MKINRLLILTLIVLTFLFLFDVYYFLSPQKDSFAQEQLEIKKIYSNQFKDQVSNIYSNELQKVNNGKLFLKSMPVKLQEIILNSPILVFRFSLFNCTACVNFGLDKLQEYFKDFASNNRIILIYDDENMRVSGSMFGKMPYVTKDRYILGLPMEKSNTPFIFLLDSDMKAKQFFVPEKEMPSLTDEYLSIIKKRYFSNVAHDFQNNNKILP